MNRKDGLPVLWIVIPCYNEEAVLKITAPMFIREIETLVAKNKVSPESRVLFVNDGSTDTTWDIICTLAREDERILGISQSRNRGHQNALLAGLMECRERCDISISIDCDGQDDISAMEEMVDAWRDGNEIVYGIRDDRRTDSVFKRFTAETYYKLLNLLGAEIVYNHADYRLLSSRVLRELADYHEVNLFLRGLIPMIGFKSTGVYYKREERLAGKSHYPLRKMLHLSFDGITSLSVKPTSIIIGFGLLVCFIGVIGMIWAFVSALTGNTVPGWASIVCIMLFLGGIQLLSLGVVGMYIGKIYLETKARPRYIISERTYDAGQSSSGRGEAGE